MAVKALLGNGSLLMRDHGLMAVPSATLVQGVRKNYLNECEVTLNQVDTGIVFVQATRDTVTPSEVFLIPLWITTPHVVDTSGNGWIIARVSESVLDAENASADGSTLAVVEKVTSLPSGNYVILATLASGVITDARTYAEISDYVLKNPVFYDEDVEASDSYAITVNGIIAYQDGQNYTFKANTANTGAATLNVNGIGAKAIKIRTDADLVTGDIEAGSIVEVAYDADNDWFQMLTPSSLAPSVPTKADQSEAEAGTNDEKFMTPLKTRQAIDNLRFLDGVAGEAINGSTTPKVLAKAGDAFRDVVAIHLGGTGISGLDWSVPSFSGVNMGQNDTNYKVAQSFTVPNRGQTATRIKSITVFMEKTNAPVDNVLCEVMGHSTDKPDNVVITNGSSATQAGSAFENGNLQPVRFTFASDPDVQAYVGTKLWAAFRRSATHNATNYYKIAQEGADNYASHGQSTYTLSTTTWAAETVNDLMMLVEFEMDFGGQIYMADSNDLTKCQVVGVTKENVSAAAAIEYYPLGIPVDGFTGLTDGSEQFVSDTAGARTEGPTMAADRCLLPLGDAHSDEIILLSDREKVFHTQISRLDVKESSGAVNLKIPVPTGIKPKIIDIEYTLDDGTGNDGQLYQTRWIRDFQKGGLWINVLSNTMTVQATTTVDVIALTTAEADYISVDSIFGNGIVLNLKQTDTTITGFLNVKITVYGH